MEETKTRNQLVGGWGAFTMCLRLWFFYSWISQILALSGCSDQVHCINKDIQC